MELRVFKVNGEVKFGFDLTPKELSDLKDELCSDILDSNSAIVRDHEGLADSIFGTLSNFGVVIE